jgi:hypothetical protein
MNQAQFQMELEEKKMVLQMSLGNKAEGPAFFEGENLLTEDLEQGEVIGISRNGIT